jgi:uncharacterized membrane protein
MESLGIILSVPVAFVASVVYALILEKVMRKLPSLIHPLGTVSVAIVLGSIVETITKTAIGAIRLREIIGSPYYTIHVALFLLTLPALATVMRFQNKFQRLSRWYSIGSLCAVVGLWIVLQQYDISEALFGVDGMGGPYGKP